MFCELLSKAGQESQPQAADKVTTIGEFEYPNIITIYPKLLEAEA